MTPINHVKFGQMTNISRFQDLKRTLSTKTNLVDKTTTSVWDDAKAARQKKQVVSAEQIPTASNFNQLTNYMSLLNSFFGSMDNLTKTSDTVNNATQNVQSAPGGGGSPSGLAQGLSGAPIGMNNSAAYNALSSKVDNNSLSPQELSNFIDSQVNPYVNTVNSTLTTAKADYNVLLGQKDEAAANVSTLQEQVGTAETSYKTAEKDLSNNESDLNSAVQSRDQLDSQLSSINSDYKAACDDVIAKEQAKSSAQTQVSNCKSSVSGAETKLSTATSTYNSAEQALANTPETLEDGTPNPAYEAAKSARDSAKEEMEKAKSELDQAKQQLESAEQNFDNAEQELGQAQDSKKEILQNLTQTESEHKQLAQNCLRLENQVEAAQKNYDNSINIYDDSKNNYERLNTELESSAGILTKCEEYKNNITNLEAEANKANALKEKANKALSEKREINTEISAEDFDKVKDDLLAHSSASEGCSANKTILENLIASKDYDLSKCSGNLWSPNSNLAYGSAATFEQQGYIKNQDGSFTDPRTGVTMMNVVGDDYTWVSQEYFAGAGEVSDFGTKSAAGRDFPGLFDAIERNKTQYNAHIGLDGFSSNGEPNFRKMRFKMNGGTTY